VDEKDSALEIPATVSVYLTTMIFLFSFEEPDKL